MNFLTTFLKNSLKQSMPYIGGELVSWQGKEIEVIYHEELNHERLAMGGFNPDQDKIIIFIPVDHFPDSARPEMGQLVTVRGVEWRISRLAKGDVRWELDLVNKDKREDG